MPTDQQLTELTTEQKEKEKDLWLSEAIAQPSPNFNQRPDPEDIDLLVIHNISLPPGQFGGDHIERFFTNRLDSALHPFFKAIQPLKVSAHLLIKRDGTAIQFVPLNQRAWHAGLSRFQGRTNCNDFSIGIELEGTDTYPYTEQQYQSLAYLTRIIQQHYPRITSTRISGHSDIAPDRKTDPGVAFDWERYQHSITESLTIPAALKTLTP